MKISIYIFLLLFSTQLNFAFSSPKTDEPKSGIFAKVNGKPWSAGVTFCNENAGSIEIGGFSMQEGGIMITVNEFAAGTFEISKKSKNKASYTAPDKAEYILDKKDIGKVTITKYNKEQKILSGTFELTLTDTKTGKKVNITNGIFTDLQYFDPPAMDSKLEAKLNGVKFNFEAAVHNVIKDTASFGGTDGITFFHIQFPAQSAPGDYFFTPGGNFKAVYEALDGSSEPLKSKSGKLTILINDPVEKVITGTFEVELQDVSGKNKAKFTEGSFVLPYRE